jgi:NAD(P)-dependent dehydrogenase (short-subunit alcohol dehydrogenase family)
MLSLHQKNILVTGASSGIGKHIALTAASIGATVTITGRDEQRLKETLGQLQGEGHYMVTADLTTAQGIEAVTGQAQNYDGVVFNAGVADYLPVKFITADKIDNIFSLNINSAMLLCQQLLKKKKICKKGSLVFISSISARLGVPGTALYAASKAALSAFSKVTAAELAPQGIRSNAVCPGIVVTPMTGTAVSVMSAEEVTKASADYPLGYGEPADVSGLVMYLLSDTSKWMTGTELVIDGGLTLK